MTLLFISCKEEKKATEPKTEPITIEKKNNFKISEEFTRYF